jgi:hypothetical protein
MTRSDDPSRDDAPIPSGPPPQSGMGGAADAGAHGRHPASSPAIAREGRSPYPDADPGDVSIERRRHSGSPYPGPERRVGRSGPNERGDT